MSERRSLSIPAVALCRSPPAAICGSREFVVNVWPVPPGAIFLRNDGSECPPHPIEDVDRQSDKDEGGREGDWRGHLGPPNDDQARSHERTDKAECHRKAEIRSDQCSTCQDHEWREERHTNPDEVPPAHGYKSNRAQDRHAAASGQLLVEGVRGARIRRLLSSELRLPVEFACRAAFRLSRTVKSSSDAARAFQPTGLASGPTLSG